MDVAKQRQSKSIIANSKADCDCHQCRTRKIANSAISFNFSLGMLLYDMIFAS